MKRRERGPAVTMRGWQDIMEITIDGGGVAAAGRLDWLCGLVDRRLMSLDDLAASREGWGRPLLPPAWTQMPAFEVHIESGLEAVLADPECRLNLRHIVMNGERARLVVFLHEPLTEVSRLLAMSSGFLAASLIEGRALRHMSPRPAEVVMNMRAFPGKPAGPHNERNMIMLSEIKERLRPDGTPVGSGPSTEYPYRVSPPESAPGDGTVPDDDGVPAGPTEPAQAPGTNDPVPPGENPPDGDDRAE